MTTIKGPIIFKKGFNARDFMKEHADKIKVKLPFTATGWKSTKTPAVADMSGIKLAKDTKVKKKLTEKELYVLTKDEQVNMFKELGVTGKDIPKYEKDRVKKLLKLQ